VEAAAVAEAEVVVVVARMQLRAAQRDAIRCDSEVDAHDKQYFRDTSSRQHLVEDITQTSVSCLRAWRP
jgi:hypothetical protein